MEINLHKKPRYRKSFISELRKHQTEAEKLLWKQLTGKRFDGVTFQRQLPLLAYRKSNSQDTLIIADFYCPQCKLIIEIDGSASQQHSAKNYDQFHQQLLASLGYSVLMITNEEIMHDIETVVNKISLAIHHSPLP